MTTKVFNVNHTVRVRLTDRGRAEMQRKHDELNALVTRNGFPPLAGPYPKEVDGWSRWQLWSLMAELGPLCMMGFDPPFETEIVLELEDGES